MNVAIQAGQLRDGMANTFQVGTGLGGVLSRTAEGALGYPGMVLPERTVIALQHVAGLGEVADAAVTRAAALEAAAPKAAAEISRPRGGPAAVARSEPSVPIVARRDPSPKGGPGSKPG